MIVDSSALVTILRNESGARDYVAAIKSARLKFMAAPTYLEVCMVMIGRKDAIAKEDVDGVISQLEVAIVPFEPAMAQAAVQAFIAYGKGRHPAGLNFGDCISYALAKAELMPLLFKGDDFRLTDIEAAL